MTLRRKIFMFHIFVPANRWFYGHKHVVSSLWNVAKHVHTDFLPVSCHRIQSIFVWHNLHTHQCTMSSHHCKMQNEEKKEKNIWKNFESKMCNFSIENKLTLDFDCKWWAIQCCSFVVWHYSSTFRRHSMRTSVVTAPPHFVQWIQPNDFDPTVNNTLSKKKEERNV